MSVIVKRVRKLNIILKTIRFNAKLSFFLFKLLFCYVSISDWNGSIILDDATF